MTVTARIALCLFLVFFCLYTLTMAGHFFSQDGEILYRAAVSFAEGRGGAVEALHGRSAVVGPDGRVHEIVMESWGTRTGRDGKEYPQYGVGQPVLAIPLVGVGRVGSRVLPESLGGAFDHVFPLFQYHGDTWRDWYRRFAVSRFNQVIVPLTVVVLFLFIFRLSGSHGSAVGTAVIYGLGTMAWVHSRTFFTEPLAGLFILLAFFLAERSRSRMEEGSDEGYPRGLRRGGWAGLAFGAAVITRLDSVVFLPGLLVILLYPRRPDRPVTLESLRRTLADRETWLRLAWFGVPVLLVAAAMAWMNDQRFGSPFSSGYSDQPEGIRFHLPLDGLAGFLFSPGKSIFVYSPPVLLGLLAWPRFHRRYRRLALGLAVGAGAFFLFEASWQNWEGGWCWGPRHIFQLTALLMLPAGTLFAPGAVDWTPGRKIGLGVLLVFGFLVQLIGISEDFVRAMYQVPPAQRPLTLFHPMYSHIVLHLDLLFQGKHDLFFLSFARATHPAWWLVPAFILGVLAFAVFLLVKHLRDAREAALR